HEKLEHYYSINPTTTNYSTLSFETGINPKAILAWFQERRSIAFNNKLANISHLEYTILVSINEIIETPKKIIYHYLSELPGMTLDADEISIWFRRKNRNSRR